jgi:CRP-like cAMP-binding protein
MLKELAKGTLVLREGEKCRECFFVLKGCMRSYQISGGDEKTAEFYTEGDVVSPSCYGTDSPSEIYLECLEDVVAAIATPEFEKEMLVKYPQLIAMGRIIGEKLMAKMQDDFSDFRMASPEQRYLNLIEKRGDLLQRVPQHMVASYLGMKPESLSRIRRRLAKR